MDVERISIQNGVTFLSGADNSISSDLTSFIFPVSLLTLTQH